MSGPHYEWRGTQFVPITRTGWVIIGVWMLIVIALSIGFTIALLVTDIDPTLSTVGFTGLTFILAGVLIFVCWKLSKPAKD